MIFHEIPTVWSPRFEVVSCIIERRGKILLLHRHPAKPQGDTWGLPAGKREPNESLRAALVRELAEEISISVSEAQLVFFRTVFVKYPEYDFPYHIFTYAPEKRLRIRLNLIEHLRYRWVRPADALSMPLIADEDACIKMRFFPP